MRRSRIAGLLLLGIGALMLVAPPVALSSTPSASSTKTLPGLKGIPDLSSAAKQRWARLITAARQEGSLIAIMGNSALQTNFLDAFGSEFGIQVTNVIGSPSTLSSRILAERQQGVHAEDITELGESSTGRLLQANAYQPLIPNIIIPYDLQRSKGWYYNKFPWLAEDTTHQYCTYVSMTPGNNVAKIFYNTNLVKPSQLSSWNDLLDPKYKGKIVMQNVAQGVNEGDRVLSWALLGKKYFEKLMKQDPTVLDQGSDVTATNGLARGQWDFAIFIGDPTPYQLAEQQGLPIAELTKVLKPGTLSALGQTLCMLAQAPHQAAAQLFVNWELSPEGQAAFNKYDSGFGDVALRSTVPKGTEPGTVWLAARRTKSVFLESDHPSDVTGSLEWWTAEFNKLGIH